MAPNASLVMIGFTFGVRWAPTEGCTLAVCAGRVLEALKATSPGIVTTPKADSAGGLDAVRLEQDTPDERLAAWVVVKGDRSWAMLFHGPTGGFDDVLADVRPIVASMAFGA
jgi:hypothetical protein